MGDYLNTLRTRRTCPDATFHPSRSPSNKFLSAIKPLFYQYNARCSQSRECHSFWIAFVFLNLTCFCLLSSLPSSPHFIFATSKAATSRLRGNLTCLVMDLLTVPSLIGTFCLLLATINGSLTHDFRPFACEVEGCTVTSNQKSGIISHHRSVQ